MESASTGIGGELARAREARGLALADVAQQLKFAARQLEALEQERFDLLPGGTFARGMVRSYARLLKLEPEPLLSRLGEHPEYSNMGRLAERYREPVPFSDSSRRSTLIYLGVSLAILAAVGTLAYEWNRERAAPRKPAAAVGSKAVPKPAAPRPTVVEDKKIEPPRTIASPAPGVHRIVLRIEREAWIEVRDGAERLLISSLNPAGTERVVQGRPPFSLVIGNAQHVRVIYDDKPVDLQPHVKVEVARLTLK
jgi:cytoskeleton protein RodZ